MSDWTFRDWLLAIVLTAFAVLAALAAHRERIGGNDE